MKRKTIKSVILPSESGPFIYMHQNKKRNFDIAISFHKIKLYAYATDIKLKGLKNFLLAISSSHDHKRSRSGLVTHIYKIKLNGEIHQVILRDCHFNNFNPRSPIPPYVLLMRTPPARLLRLIEGASRYNIRWSISEVEFVCDFLGADPHGIYDFLKRHIFMSWRGREFITDYPDGMYLNNVYLSKGLGGKIYIRPDVVPYRVRIELTAKRQSIRKKDIITLFDLLTTRPEDIFRRVRLKNIREDRFGRHLDREDKKNGHPLQAKARLQEMRDVWGKRGINSALDVIAKYNGNPSYCREDHPFQEEFTSALKILSFSNGVKWRKNSEGNWNPASWAIPSRRTSKAMRKMLQNG